METIKKRVYWIYHNYRDAVEHNVVLNSIYQNYFGNVPSTTTIERAGRYWRALMPNTFRRSHSKIERDIITKQEILRLFT